MVAASLAVTGVGLASAAVPEEAAQDPLAVAPLVGDEGRLPEDDFGPEGSLVTDTAPDPEAEPVPPFGGGTEPVPGVTELDPAQSDPPEEPADAEAEPEAEAPADVEAGARPQPPPTPAAVRLSADDPVTEYRKIAPTAADAVKDASARLRDSGPAGRKADETAGDEESSARSRARVASHDGFVHCHGVPAPDKAPCEELLTRLLEEQLSICTDARRLDPACREASVRFTIEAACVAQPDRDACRERLRGNPCFEDPLSRACNSFLDTREVLACRGDDSEIIAFRCTVIGGALELFCLEHQAAGIPVDTTRCPQAGPGLESAGPGAREGTMLASAPGSGGGASTLVGLHDPGSRGDLGLATDDSGADSKPRGKLARTGPALPGLLLAGLLMGFGGFALRRRVRS